MSEHVTTSVREPATSAELVDPSSTPTQDRQSDITRFSVMGGYSITGLLGEGAMGKVYRANHDLLGRPAAIKVLHKEHADKQAIERFFREARAASAIEHPGIVKVYEVGENDEGSFLIMEMLEGEDLEARLQREQRLDVQDAARFAVQIASALEVAHANNIVHRDLKPGNLFVIKDDQVSGGERIKILDFGIAKVQATEKMPNTNATRSDMLLGSPAYMSPEQCRGADKVDGRADLYSLGCILFEMLCGRPPFDQQVVAAVIAAHMRQEPPTLTSLRPEISPELERIVMRLLAKEPAERFQSAAQFIEAMIQGAGHSLVLDNVSKTLIGASRLLTAIIVDSKRRRWFGLFTALTLAAIGLFVVLTLRSADSPEQPQTSVGQTKLIADDAVNNTLPAAKRPRLRVRMLADGTNKKRADAKQFENKQFIDLENMDLSIEEILNGQLSIKMANTIELIQFSEQTHPVITWNIDSDPPGAEVLFKEDKTALVEGKRTPVSVEFDIVTREDILIVRLDGYEDEEIAARFDSSMNKLIKLEPIRTVEIATEPSGSAVFDGSVKLSNTPWTTTVRRRSTARTLTIKHPDYEHHEIKIGPREPDPGVITLQPLLEVTIDSRPKGAHIVTESDEFVAKTPWTTKLSRRSQDRNLLLRYPKYEDYPFTLGPNVNWELFDQGPIPLLPLVKLAVRTVPKKATILDESGQPIATTPWTQLVSRKDPERMLTITAPRYEEYSLAYGANLELPRRIKLTKIPVLSVNSRPGKVDVFGPDGDKLGNTPMRIPLSSKQGSLALVLRSPTHEDLSVLLESGKRPPKRYVLKPLPRVRIDSKPRKASVYDESGKRLGQTPLRLTFAKDKKPFNLTLRKNGFQDKELLLTYGQSTTKRVALVPLKSAVAIRTSPSDVGVFSPRGKKLGDTPMSLAMDSTSPPMEIVLRRDGYREQQITVRYGDELPKKFVLTRLIAIKLDSKPSGATVTNSKGTRLGQTPLSMEVDKSDDPLTFIFERAGYEPKTVRVVPKRDYGQRITLTRLPQQVAIAIASQPSGVEVWVANKMVGRTPYTRTQLETSGRTDFWLRRKGYHSRRVRVKNNENRRESIKLETCDAPNEDDIMLGIINPNECKN